MEVRHEADEYEARLADVVSVVRETIRRRWMVLLAVTLGIFLLGIGIVSQMTPQYSAMAKVRLDPSRNPANNAQQARADLSEESIQTELTQIRSLAIARQVVRSLGLIDDPEFAQVLNKTTNTPVTNTEAREAVVANAVLQHITVAREKDTYVLDISAQSTDPIKAARIANAFASGYIEYRASSRTGTAREQAEWYQQQLATLGREASEAGRLAAEYRVRAGIVGRNPDGSGGGTLADQQLAPLTGTLAQAASDAAAARASLAAAQSQAARGSYESIPEVLSSAVVQSLRAQRADAVKTQREFELRYGERHPESIRVRDQVTSLDAQIKAEARRILTSMQANSAAASARVDSLRGSLGQLENERERSVSASSSADNLQREADAKRALYDKMSQMSLDSLQASTSTLAVAQIAVSAEPPSAPVSPNKPLLYLLSFIVGLAAGGATIAAQELMSGGFRSVEDLEKQLGLPVLAVVPKVRKSESPTELMLERPTSMFSEAFRIARTAVLGARGEAKIKVIAITSSLPAEGKTTSAVAFARTLAIANAKVLLLECDVRRASVRHIVRGNHPKVGLVELLHGEISLDEAIEPGDVPNLDQILVASPYFSAENLFGEGRMEQVLAAVRDRYDYIVLDLPPLMGLADGRYLAVLADATALVVKWGSTPIAAATSAIGWLRSDGANPVGAIYTQVDPSAHSVGGLYYYSKQYSEYYQAN
jgi:capsular exopolysaccharide synthesis family protein